MKVCLHPDHQKAAIRKQKELQEDGITELISLGYFECYFSGGEEKCIFKKLVV